MREKKYKKEITPSMGEKRSKSWGRRNTTVNADSTLSGKVQDETGTPWGRSHGGTGRSGVKDQWTAINSVKMEKKERRKK